MNKNNKNKVWTRIGTWDKAWKEYTEHKESEKRRLIWEHKNRREGYPHEK